MIEGLGMLVCFVCAMFCLGLSGKALEENKAGLSIMYFICCFACATGMCLFMNMARQ